LENNGQDILEEPVPTIGMKKLLAGTGEAHTTFEMTVPMDLMKKRVISALENKRELARRDDRLECSLGPVYTGCN
jgi:hypothetical protein